jgi:hypothetical protein
MEWLKEVLDGLPLATIMTVGGGILALIGYLNHDLTIAEALAAWGVTGIGGGQVGRARNEAGRGVKR